MSDLTDLDRFTAVLQALESDLPARAFTGLGRLVQRELKEHGPVPLGRLEQLRVEAGASVAAVEALSALAETGAHGRITGATGLTVNPTAHELRVDGQALYTWCAFDGIVLPIAHGWTADVRSVCPATGQSIAVTVTPQAVTRRDPEEAVLAVVVPSGGASPDTAEHVRAVFCARNNLYASAAAAREVTADDPDVVLVDVDDAHRFGQRLVEALGVGPAAADAGPGGGAWPERGR